MKLYDMDLHLFKELSEQCDIHLSKDQIEAFGEYYSMMLYYNKAFNLTTITKHNDVIIKHFIDSMMLFKKVCIPKNQKVIDVGTGLGMPGIALKILRPDIDICLVDSLKKRVNFLNRALSFLNFDNALAVHSNVKDLCRMTTYRQSFDFVTCRALGNMDKISALCIPFLKIGGIFAPLRGRSIKEDVASSYSTYTKLGCEYKESFIYELPEEKGKRGIIVLYRKAKTLSENPDFCVDDLNIKEFEDQ